MESPEEPSETLVSLESKFKKIRKRTQEILNSHPKSQSCTYSEGYMDQEMFHCKTCNLSDSGSAICFGCVMDCHLDHDIVEIGFKPKTRCDCGSPITKNACSLIPSKELSANKYDHNFLGKFCLCEITDLENSDSNMHMCILCFDWFHESCIQLANNSHNFSDRKYHQENVPGIPSEGDWILICCKCLSSHSFIPAAYREFIFTEKPVKRQRKEDCPVKNAGKIEQFPYHIFLNKDWEDERCNCEECSELYKPFSYIKATERATLMEEIEFEADKIMNQEVEEGENDSDNDEELLDGIQMPPLSHEMQVEVANGVQLFSETLGEYLSSLKDGVFGRQHAEEFSRHLSEKFEEYKRNRLG